MCVHTDIMYEISFFFKSSNDKIMVDFGLALD